MLLRWGVRYSTERASSYLDPERCAASSACTPIRGDWDVLELVKYRSEVIGRDLMSDKRA